MAGFRAGPAVNRILRLAAARRGGLNPPVHPLVQEVATTQTPESLVEQLGGRPGIRLLRSAGFDSGEDICFAEAGREVRKQFGHHLVADHGPS